MRWKTLHKRKVNRRARWRGANRKKVKRAVHIFSDAVFTIFEREHPLEKYFREHGYVD